MHVRQCVDGYIRQLSVVDRDLLKLGHAAGDEDHHLLLYWQCYAGQSPGQLSQHRDPLSSLHVDVCQAQLRQSAEQKPQWAGCEMLCYSFQSFDGKKFITAIVSDSNEKVNDLVTKDN